MIDHQNASALIPEILLYDRLVFPVPPEGADLKAWQKWNPELLKKRMTELKGLVHTVPWTSQLHDEWAARWEQMKKVGLDTKRVATGLTPMVLAMSAFADAVPPPIMIAAYQDPALARADVALIESPGPQAKAREELDREVRALFERRLDMPVVMHPYETYHKAIELAHDAEYQKARRSLFAWEDQMVAAGWPTEASIKKLEELVEAHDDFIKRNFAMTAAIRVFRVVEFLTEAAVVHATGDPIKGLAAAGVMKVVGARLPEPDDPVVQPGAALHRAVSVMFHE